MAVELNIKTNVDVSSAKKANEEIEAGAKKSEQAIDGMTSSIDSFTGGAVSAFNSFKSGAASGITAMKTLKGAIALTGIGALLIAVTSLVSYFTKTQAGADKLDQAFAIIGATVDVLIDRISAFGEGLFKIISGDFSAGLDILKNSFKGITAEIEKEATAAYGLEKASQQLIKTKRAFIEQEAKLNSDLEKYRLASEDFDLSTAERLKANNMAQKTAIELANQRAAIAAEDLRLLQEKNALGNSLNDDLDAEAEAKARLFEIEGQRNALAKEFQAKAKSITDEQKSAAAADAAEKKALEEEASKARIELAKAEAQALIEQRALEDAARLEAIKELDNQIREIKLENEEVLLEDILVFEEAKRDLELEQLELSEAQKAAIRLSYLEKVAAAEKETGDKIVAQKKLDDDKDLAIAAANAEAKTSIMNSVFQIGAMLGEKNVGIAKGVAVAQATMNTFQGVTAALAQTTDPTPVQALRFANAAAVGVVGILNVSKILNASSKSKSAPTAAAMPSTGGGGSSTPSLPSFDFINQGVGGTQNAGFNSRAIVINQDIKDASALDARITDLSRA